MMNYSDLVLALKEEGWTLANHDDWGKSFYLSRGIDPVHKKVGGESKFI